MSADPDALARASADAMLARDRFAQHLGIAVEEVRAGFARLSLIARDELLMGHGFVHGGVIFTLADAAFAYACNSRNEPNVALQCSISFTRAARSGQRLTAVAEGRAGGARTGVYDVTVTDDAGTLVALFRGVCYRIRGSVIEREPA